MSVWSKQTLTMTNWEFQIQKEGDQIWLPLELPTAEIIEGRYRLIAQVGCANEPVLITIQHQYEHDGVWQDTQEEQLHHTDDQGRLEILPLTYLGCGVWTIHCSPPLESTSESKPMVQNQALHLQVLDEDYEFLGDWQLLDVGPTATSPASAQMSAPTGLDPASIPEELVSPPELELNLEAEVGPSMSKQLSEDPTATDELDSLLQEFSFTVPSQLPDLASTDTTEPAGTTDLDLSVQDEDGANHMTPECLASSEPTVTDELDSLSQEFSFTDSQPLYNLIESAAATDVELNLEAEAESPVAEPCQVAAEPTPVGELDSLRQGLDLTESDPLSEPRVSAATSESELNFPDITNQSRPELQQDSPEAVASVDQDPFLEAVVNLSTREPSSDTTESTAAVELECTQLEDASQPSPENQPVATTPAATTEPEITFPAELNPPAPELLLPTFTKQVPVLRCQRSPGLILPPELYSPSELLEPHPEPQLPVFAGSPREQTPPLETLSSCSNQLTTCLDEDAQASIDQDFASLDLHQRFWQTLNTLAVHAPVAVAASTSSEPVTSESESHIPANANRGEG